jgi:hypothetical protein
LARIHHVLDFSVSKLFGAIGSAIDDWCPFSSVAWPGLRRLERTWTEHLKSLVEIFSVHVAQDGLVLEVHLLIRPENDEKESMFMFN